MSRRRRTRTLPPSPPVPTGPHAPYPGTEYCDTFWGGHGCDLPPGHGGNIHRCLDSDGPCSEVTVLGDGPRAQVRAALYDFDQWNGDEATFIGWSNELYELNVFSNHGRWDVSSSS